VLGKDFTAADYIQLGFDRAALLRDAAALCTPYDAMLYPTAAAVAPSLAEADKSDDDYFRINMRLLRNTGLGNILDGCGISLPCQAPGEPPVGLSVAGLAGPARHVLAVSRAIEAGLAAITQRG
jgi:aspartyl-tRNA(Asn)/glutamyl-tRNA(Gln) amidotransferase subunit A